MGEIIEKRRRDYSGLDADKASIPAGGKAIHDTYFATDTKIAYFWDSVAWIIIPLDVIVAGMIKTDAVETAKIKDLNVTKGKAEIGFGRYVSRAVAAADFSAVDFTRDGNWHADGLDLSVIVPEGAIGIAISWAFRATEAGVHSTLRANATTKVENSLELKTSLANVFTSSSFGVIYCDSDRLLDYSLSAVCDMAKLSVVGWVI